MKNILVFGQGFLGYILAEQLGGSITPQDPNNLEYTRYLLDSDKPDIVINAIGKTGKPDIDWCEKNKEDTMQSNVIAATNLAIECSRRNIYFVHFSSGCIYTDKYGQNNFSENVDPNFYGGQYYGDTKILAEKIISKFPALQIRLRMPICDYPHERNLIDKLKKYKKVADIKNSMTCIDDLIYALKILIEQKALGIYNVVNDGAISPFEIMKMYERIVDNNHICEPIGRSDLNKITVGERSNCILSTQKLKERGIMLPNIHKAVEKCLMQYKIKVENDN